MTVEKVVQSYSQATAPEAAEAAEDAEDLIYMAMYIALRDLPIGRGLAMPKKGLKPPAGKTPSTYSHLSRREATIVVLNI